MKRERPEAAGDRLALADQGGCSAQPNGKARALPASDGKPVNHDGHGCTMAELVARVVVHSARSATAEEEAALHVVRMTAAADRAALLPPTTAEEAVAQAEAEGLTLVRSSANQSGFRSVFIHTTSKARPYQASVWRGDNTVHLGCFATAEEAALHVARTPEAQAAAALPPPMTAEEALAQAEAEGLTLIRSDGQSGFCNVAVDSRNMAKPYEARVWRGGKQVHLGYFATAEEAALHHARTPEAQAAALEAKAKALAKAEAQTQAQAKAQAKAEAKAEAKLAAKAAAVRARQEQKL
eukprot:scaffold53852_cov74-Phaeocystis_antarctica.AAC.1